MKKYIILLAYAIRKNRLQLLSFSAIVLISALFLNLGLTVAFNFGDVYRHKWIKSNMADAFFVMSDADYSEDAITEIRAYPEVSSIEERDCYYLFGEFSSGDDVRVSMPMVIYNRNDQHTMNQYILVDAMSTKQDHAAYVSYWFYTDKGCNLGDTLHYTTATHSYEFTIEGFVEDMQYGNNNCGGIAIHLSESNFMAFENIVEDGRFSRAVNLRTHTMEQGERVYQRALQRMSADWANTYEYNSSNFESSKNMRTLMTTIMAYMIVAFALAITGVGLLVCGFRIGNGIQEDMRNMGIQNSIGYRSGQIRFFVALPYIVLCLVSTTGGIVMSMLVLPAFTSLVETLTGLVWKQAADMFSIMMTSVILLLAVILTVAGSTRKLRQQSPIAALQSGISRHNFKRNVASLEKMPPSVTLALGCKNFLGAFKQNIVLALILAAVTFLAMYATSAYYNMVIKTDNFISSISEEMSNVYVVTNGQAKELADVLAGEKGIDRTLPYDEKKIMLDNKTLSAFLCDDFSMVKYDLIYEGRSPLHDNEIALGSKARNGISIGDTVTISHGDSFVDYLVVGFMQAPNRMGQACEMTGKGFQRLDRTYTHSVLNIYLNDEMTADECIDMLKIKASHLIIYIGNNDKTYETSMGTYMNMTSSLVSIIAVIVIMVLALVLLIVFSTIIIQKRSVHGILKSMGYTTKQLIIQTILGIFPALICGIFAGCLAGVLWMNQVWLLAFSFQGTQKVNLGVPVSGAVGVGLLILLLSLILSVMLCTKIRHISVRELIQE